MPLRMVKENITEINCDAVVIPVDSEFNAVDEFGAEVHRAAGDALMNFCGKMGKCAVGKAVITPAFSLKCEYVVHTALCICSNEPQKSENTLRSCYTESLELAYEYQCARVAIPLITSEVSGYSKDRILKIAERAISDFLDKHEMTVTLVLSDKDSYSIGEKLYSDVESFISGHYDDGSSYSVPDSADSDGDARLKRYSAVASAAASIPQNVVWGGIPMDQLKAYSLKQSGSDIGSYFLDDSKLNNMLSNMDKGFRDTLFYYIDKKGLSDVECYKRSNVDKKTFSKIKCNADYRPSKVTAVSFAVGLHLDIGETEHLLSTAGMCLSRSSKFDVIIEYFITSGMYETIFDINEVLYQFDQSLLGV